MFRCAPQVDNSDQHSRSILPAALAVLGKAYPANDAPGVEVAGELALIFVARHQHDDAPIVDVLQVDGGRSTQIAREGLCGLEHHLLPDPGFGDLPFGVRGAGPLPIHHSSLFFSVPSIYKGRTKKGARRDQGERGCGTSNVCYNIEVSLYLVQEVRKR